MVDLSRLPACLLTETVDHLMSNVLSAAADYHAAEMALSGAYRDNSAPAGWDRERREALRHAAQLAIAIDGLSDRYAEAAQLADLHHVRNAVDALCFLHATTERRAGCMDRIRGVANAYKHSRLRDPSLPIWSKNDVLVVAVGYGLEAFGVGKFGGVEVVVRQKPGDQWKFLGDAPVAVAAWFRFLNQQGASLPAGPFSVCGVTVHPQP